MTKAQISTILGSTGVDKWNTLKDFFTIQLTNDGRLWPAEADSQYYFDTTRSLVYVRYTMPRPFAEKKQDDMVQVELTKGTYWLQLLPGGMSDSKVGRFHEVFDFNGITTMQ